MNEKTDNINEFIETIEEKKQTAFNLDKLKQQNLSCMHRFFQMKNRLFYYRVCIKFWKKYIKHKKAKKRVAAYSRNTIYRNMMKRIYKSWRNVSHEWGKERINREEKTFRRNMEIEKVTMWTSKVDQLMLYMA